MNIKGRFVNKTNRHFNEQITMASAKVMLFENKHSSLKASGAACHHAFI